MGGRCKEAEKRGGRAEEKTVTFADDAKKPTLDVTINELASPKAYFGVRGEKLFLVSSEAVNKKVPKDTVLAYWTSEIGVKADEVKWKEWDINLKSEILWKPKDTMQRFRMDKLLKEGCPTVGDVWKCVPFPAGMLPKILVKKEPQKSYGFVSRDKNKDDIHNAIHLARSCVGLSALWILKATPQKTSGKLDKLDPAGLAIVTNKQLVLPGNGELGLE